MDEIRSLTPAEFVEWATIASNKATTLLEPPYVIVKTATCSKCKSILSRTSDFAKPLSQFGVYTHISDKEAASKLEELSIMSVPVLLCLRDGKLSIEPFNDVEGLNELLSC
jgi:hypothetical protein